MKILFKNKYVLGDAAEDLIALHHLHLSHPDVGINFDGCGRELFDNVPWINRAITEGTADKVCDLTQSLIHGCNSTAVHVVRCIEHDIAAATGLAIRVLPLSLPICFTAKEQEDTTLWRNVGLAEKGYWVVDAGGKADTTTKIWPRDYFQEVIDRTRHAIQWAQIGLPSDLHRPLENCVNLIGKTPKIRDLCRVIWRSAGVLTGISAPLHLATMPMRDSNNLRPCVVVGGGREPASYTLYPNHHHFSAVGSLPCCRNGGCWKANVMPRNGGRDCERPTEVGGQECGQCMADIKPREVADKILSLCK